MKDRYSLERISLISHKLRTPLTVIVSSVNNLLDGAFGKLNSEQKKWLEKLADHTATFEHLLDEILDILKGEISCTSDEISRKTDEVIHESSQPKAPTHLESKMNLFDWDRVPRILIVDDEPDVLETIQEGMTIKGFQSMTASSGEEALKAALSQNPDLILMDVVLKNQNGVEVCREIKSKLPTFTPVLLVTGQDNLSFKITGEKNDPDDLLMKPFQMQELFSRVTSMLRLKKLYDELEWAIKKGKG